MPAEKNALIAALAPIESAVQALATALDVYDAAYKPVTRAAFASPEKNRQTTFAMTFAPAIARANVVMRLKTLGHAELFDHARRSGILPATWVDDMTTKITALVP